MKQALLLTGILILAGTGLYFLGRPAYRHYREKRLLGEAKHFLAKGDLANALLCARQTLQSNPRNLAAYGIMADLAERMGSPVSLDWRRRLAELSPTTENKLHLAQAALRIQSPPFPLARQILDELEGLA